MRPSKLFATSFEDATSFGRLNFRFDNEPFTVVETSFPESTISKSFYFTPDGMKAVSVPAEQLQSAYWIRPHNALPTSRNNIY